MRSPSRLVLRRSLLLGSVLVTACAEVDRERHRIANSLMMPSVISAALVIASLAVVVLKLRIASIVLGSLTLLFGIGTTYTSSCAAMFSAGGRSDTVGLALAVSIAAIIIGIVSLVAGVGMKPKVDEE